MAVICFLALEASGEDGPIGVAAFGPGAGTHGSRTLAAGGYPRPIRDGYGWASHGCGTARSGSRKTAIGRLPTCPKRSFKSPPSKYPPNPRPLLVHSSPPGLRPPDRRRTRQPRTLEARPKSECEVGGAWLVSPSTTEARRVRSNPCLQGKSMPVGMTSESWSSDGHSLRYEYE
jgi:hypothetical protein